MVVAELNPGLIRLLCDQGKYDEADALVDRFAARVDWELEQERDSKDGEDG